MPTVLVGGGVGVGGDWDIKINVIVRHTDINNTNKPEKSIHHDADLVWIYTKFDSWSNVRKKNVTR